MKNFQVLGINVTVCLVLALYLLYLTYLDYTNTTNKLPTLIRTIMGSFVVRLALMVLIAATALGYNNLGGLHVAVLMAAAYLLTMSMVHKDQITENFIEGMANLNENEREHMTDKDDKTDAETDAEKAGDMCRAHYEEMPEDIQDICKTFGPNAKPSAEEVAKVLSFKPTKESLDNEPKDSSVVSQKVDNIAQAVGNCAAYNRECLAKGQEPSEMCATLLNKLDSVDIDAETLSQINIEGKGKTCVGQPDTDTKENFASYDPSPIGKAFRENMGGEPKCGPYASLDTAFNPQPFRPADSVLASGAPDQN